MLVGRDMELEHPHHQSGKHVATCIHCARVIFHSARRVGEPQLTMMHSHLLVCRPLVALQQVDDVLAHCRIVEEGRAEPRPLAP